MPKLQVHFHSLLHSPHGRRNFKDTKCLLYRSFLFGVVKQFCRFWIWSETECKTLAEYGLQHNSTPPPPQPHTVCIYCTFSLGRGEVREKGERQQYTMIVPSSMGQQLTSWVDNTNHEWIYLQSIKSVKGIFQPFELGGVTRLIPSAVKFCEAGH